MGANRRAKHDVQHTRGAGDWTLGVQNLANKQYINYVSQTVGDNDSYFAGRGRVLSLTWQQAF